MQRVFSGRPGWPPPRRRGGGGGVIAAPVISVLSSNCCGGREAGAGAKSGEDNKADDLEGPLEVGVYE